MVVRDTLLSLSLDSDRETSRNARRSRGRAIKREPTSFKLVAEFRLGGELARHSMVFPTGRRDNVPRLAWLRR